MNIVRAGMLGWIPWTYMDPVSTPPIYPPVSKASRGVYWNQAQKSFTHPYTEYPWVSVTLWLCNSVTLRPINAHFLLFHPDLFRVITQPLHVNCFVTLAPCKNDLCLRKKWKYIITHIPSTFRTWALSCHESLTQNNLFSCLLMNTEWQKVFIQNAPLNWLDHFHSS